jgi:hypothetical protein
MKKLRDILEGTVIQFKPKATSPSYITQQHIRDKVDEITTHKSNLWSHPALKVAGSIDHSITSIAHHIEHNPSTFYPDKMSDGYKDFSKRKAIATQHYINHKTDIDNHVSDTLTNLERLKASTSHEKFVTEKDRLMATKEITLAHNHWSRVKEGLSKVDS